MTGGVFVEKKILMFAGIQSFVFLALCIMTAFFIEEKTNASVQVNVLSSLDERDSYLSGYPNYKCDRSTILVDAGHGGVDSGTQSVSLNYEEKDINLAIALKVRKILEQEGRVNVIMTRETDVFLSPEQRLDLINRTSPEKIISIHCNSAGNLKAKGIEVLYNSKNKESEKLAKNCLEEIRKATSQVNRGLVNGDSIYIIRNANNPVALIEVGFISNKRELKFLLNEKNQEKIAQGIVNAVMR